jgi:predicted nucleotidyltransferase
VVLAGPGLEEDMLARARRRRVGGTDVPFVDTADLIALKILAGRDKDLEDVRALGRAGLPGRSLKVARERVAELGALIDDSTLIATFDRLIPPMPVERARATKRPRSAARKKR